MYYLDHILAADVLMMQEPRASAAMILTHWGRVTHICVSKLTIIGPDNGLSPGRRQAIIWTNAAELLIQTLGTNFSEFFSEIHALSFKKMHLKMLSAKWHPFCLGLNVLLTLPRKTMSPTHKKVEYDWLTVWLHNTADQTYKGSMADCILYLHSIL